MKKLICTLAITVISLSAAYAGPKSTEVKAVGIKIVSTAADSENNVNILNSSSHETAISIMIKATGMPLLRVDTKNAKVTSFTDDKGTDLMQKPADSKSRWGTRAGFGSFPKISKDKAVAIIEVKGPGVPAKGATSLSTEGYVTLVSASETETKTLKDQKIGLTKLDVEGFDYSISKMGTPSWGKDKENKLELTIAMKGEKSIGALKSITLVDAEGKKFEGKSSGWSSSGTNKWQTYTFDKKFETATIELELWKDIKEVKIPFKVTTSLGLGK